MYLYVYLHFYYIFLKNSVINGKKLKTHATRFAGKMTRERVAGGRVRSYRKHFIDSEALPFAFRKTFNNIIYRMVPNSAE